MRWTKRTYTCRTPPQKKKSFLLYYRTISLVGSTPINLGEFNFLPLSCGLSNVYTICMGCREKFFPCLLRVQGKCSVLSQAVSVFLPCLIGELRKINISLTTGLGKIISPSAMDLRYFSELSSPSAMDLQSFSELSSPSLLESENYYLH